MIQDSSLWSEFCYLRSNPHKELFSQVIFHTATLMPNKPSDPNGNSKKLHIGNDYVTIVYNNSEEDYEMSTIKVILKHYLNLVLSQKCKFC
jgi:hypothetical protein